MLETTILARSLACLPARITANSVGGAGVEGCLARWEDIRSVYLDSVGLSVVISSQIPGVTLASLPRGTRDGGPIMTLFAGFWRVFP